MNKRIKQAIAEMIGGGLVLSIEKTKARENGGQQVVTVGKYQTAVPTPGKKFLVHTKNTDAFFPDADSAAADFMDFVGAEHAEAAVRTALGKSGWGYERPQQLKRILRYINHW